tara:strand:- start:4257 stop:4589 length:333 start_codon:yes stop_codon:yes gene_type:complete
MSLADLRIDPILYRRTYLETWAGVQALDPGFADQELVDAITLVAVAEASQRQRIILARNLVHDHNCPSTTWGCASRDPLTLARHRTMYRAQALRMLTVIEHLTGGHLDDV